MHWCWIGFLGLIAFIWFVQSIDLAFGALSIPALTSVAPLKDADCPSVSILFAARDEAEKLPGALDTFLALDYPKYEVIAVNDRSEDATESILQSAARKDARLKVITVSSLPAGWLGKPHALQEAFEHSTGDWLIFTDADVHSNLKRCGSRSRWREKNIGTTCLCCAMRKCFPSAKRLR